MEQLFTEAIEHKLTDEIIRTSKDKIQQIVAMEQEILKAAGIDPNFLVSPVMQSGIDRMVSERMAHPLQVAINKETPMHEVASIPEPEHIENELKAHDQEEDLYAEEDEMFVGSLGGDEEDFEEMDQGLDEETQAEFLLPEDDEEEVEKELSQPEKEEEEEMEMVKDKDGNETRYEDDFMNDIQDEADEFDGGGMDDILAAASASFKEDDELEGGAVGSSNTSVANDAPTGEDGFVPDVLPSDYGMDKVSGDGGSGADFFTKAFMGESGDKSRRNQTVRKRIKTNY